MPNNDDDDDDDDDDSGANGRNIENIGLIWNIASLFDRQTVSVAVTGDKYCVFGRVQGSIEN